MICANTYNPRKARKKMLKYIVSVFFILSIFSSNCGNKKEPCAIFFPLKSDVRLNFISYVTNQQNEMIHPFEYFERRYIYTDTIGTRLIHHYLEQNKLSAFYTDDSCTIRHRIRVDLSALAINCGFVYQDSVYLTFWKPVIKVNDGVNTKWHSQVDTNFSVKTPDGA